MAVVAQRGRPPVISDEKILETARNVFLERGIRATTLEVAERARISEGTIFHRFKSKDALFRAAMRLDLGPESAASLFETLIPRVGEGHLHPTLVGLGMRILEAGRVILPVAMMSWSNPSGDFSLEKIMSRQTTFGGPLRSLCPYFEAEMDIGRLAQSDVQVLARAFLGAIRDYCMSELVQPQDPKRPNAPAFIEGLVSLLFRPAKSRSTLRK